MNNQKRISIQWKPPGQRIIKTSIAVTLCMLFYMYRGYRGETMSAEAAITAIICMQPYVHGTAENALNRLSGTLIGAVWGFLFLLLMMLFPSIGRHRVLLYLLMGFGTLVALHSAVLEAVHPVTGEKILLTSRPAWAADIPESVLLMDID